MSKPTPTQQHIINQMQQGYVLSSTLSTKYVPFNMNPEHSGTMRHPNHFSRQNKNIHLSTIKAMLAKGLIVENNRYICSSGSWGEHKTETWCINYKLNVCIHCYEQTAIAQFNHMYCSTCANEMGEQWEVKQNERVKETAQQ